MRHLIRARFRRYQLLADLPIGCHYNRSHRQISRIILSDEIPVCRISTGKDLLKSPFENGDISSIIFMLLPVAPVLNRFSRRAYAGQTRIVSPPRIMDISRSILFSFCDSHLFTSLMENRNKDYTENCRTRF